MTLYDESVAMQEIIQQLIQRNSTKIFMFVLDGVGGLPLNGQTELESARTPNLDRLAKASACGMHVPVAIGVTPGSGPGHLGIFGYDPVQWQIGRGVLEALGLGLEIRDTDIAVRCNYCTMSEGLVVDRRAGRIPTEESKVLTDKLRQEIGSIDEAELIFAAGMEHRFAVVFRFPEPLESGTDKLSDTDPQKAGKHPAPLEPANPHAEKVARIAEKFIQRASEILSDHERANYVLTRGFSQIPVVTPFAEAFGLKSLAIATYPMYRGLARLVGMDTPVVTGDIEDEIAFLRENLADYDFFFIHVKKVDSYGEDGNFGAKAKKIEEFDKFIPGILELKPDVLVITGDHSTPSTMKGHSWHPVPVLIHSPFVLGNLAGRFTERECLRGELGIIPAFSIIPLALANAGRLKKFGA